MKMGVFPPTITHCGENKSFQRHTQHITLLQPLAYLASVELALLFWLEGRTSVATEAPGFLRKQYVQKRTSLIPWAITAPRAAGGKIFPTLSKLNNYPPPP